MDQKELEKRVRILERKLERSERNRAELEEQRSRGQLLYRRLHSDLKSMQDQLIQTEKLASLGQLTAGIAHEIKNPLNFIVNFADVNVELIEEMREALAAGIDVEDTLSDLEKNAAHILEHGKRADAIVKSMMRHASGASGEKEQVDVNAFVREVADLAYKGKRARTPMFQAAMREALDPAAGSALVLSQDLGRVLLNLLDNAFDALGDRAGEADFLPAVTISTKRVGAQIEIAIEDNGPGIPEEAVDRLFEPFFTTKPAGSGTGLGLSLSYDIVTKGHGGTLTVERAPGRGARFVIRLPA